MWCYQISSISVSPRMRILTPSLRRNPLSLDHQERVSDSQGENSGRRLQFFWENASWECFLKILIIVHHCRFVIIASSGEMIAETDWPGRTGGCTGRGTGPAPTGGSCLTLARSWQVAGRPWWPGTSHGAEDRDRGRGESSTRRIPTTTASAPGSPPSPSPTRRRSQTTTASPGRRGDLMKKLNIVGMSDIVCVYFFHRLKSPVRGMAGPGLPGAGPAPLWWHTRLYNKDSDQKGWNKWFYFDKFCS